MPCDAFFFVPTASGTGTGTFGRVRLVLHKETKKYMALKILKKSEARTGATFLFSPAGCRSWLAVVSCGRSFD